MTDELKARIHKIGFWLLIVLMIGIVIGSYGMHCYQKLQMSQAVQLKAFVFNNQVYVVELRP
jgi:hypothetical protein